MAMVSPSQSLSKKSSSLGWKDAFDESGQLYLYNPVTQETKWPSPVKSQRGVRESSIESEWVSYEDEDGNAYYYNSGTGEVTWDNPESNTYDDAVNLTSPIPNHLRQQGWEKLIDNDTQSKYYYNSESQESQWNTPKRATPQKSSSSSSSTKKKDIPSGYEVAIDEETNAKYYYNIESGDAQWNTPKQKAQTPLKSPHRSDVPVSGWIMAIDNETNHKYYYNPDQDISQWETPQNKTSKRSSKSPSTSTSFREPSRDAPGSPYVGKNVSRHLQDSGGSQVKHYQGECVEDITSRKKSFKEQQEMPTEFELKIKKFEKMKKSSEIMEVRSDLKDNLVTWIMWQGANNGPIFYSIEDSVGGQWKPPSSFSKDKQDNVPRNTTSHYLSSSKDIKKEDWRDEIKASHNDSNSSNLNWDSGYGSNSKRISGDRRNENWSDDSKFANELTVNEREPTPNRESKNINTAKASLIGKFSRPATIFADEDSYDEVKDEEFDDDDESVEENEKLNIYRSQHQYVDSDDSDFEEEEGADAKRILSSKLLPRVRKNSHQSKKSVSVDENAEHDSNEPDFSIMYARSIVIKQNWPWTCLVDVESDKRFYKNESTNIFQMEIPVEFQKQSGRQGLSLEDNEFDEAYEDFVEAGDQEFLPLKKNYKKKSTTKTKKTKNGSLKGYKKKSHTNNNGAIVLGMIQPGELEANLDSRYKDEMYNRHGNTRQHQEKDDITGNDKYFHHDLSTLKKMTTFKDKLPKSGKDTNSTVKSRKKRSLSIFSRVGVTENVFQNRYAPPAGFDNKVIQRATQRARDDAGFKSGFLFLSSRRKLINSGTAEDGENHGLRGNLIIETDENAVKEEIDDNDDSQDKTLSQEKIHERDSKLLYSRLKRLATDSRQPGYIIGSDDKKVGAPKSKEAEPSATFEDLELEAHRASSKRALVLNEMRNQEKSIAGLLSMQMEMMDATHPTWIENEINRRYLIEAAVMQRSNLVMPRSARVAKAYHPLSGHYKTPNLLEKDDIEYLRKTHTIKSATDGSWTLYKILPDHISGRIVDVYINHQTGVTQTGEPFDLRCRRSRSSFKSEKWSIVSKFLPKASVIHKHNVQMLSDRDGGLLYYNPVYDRYSSNDQFDTFVSTQDVRETIKSRDKARDELIQQEIDNGTWNGKLTKSGKPSVKIHSNFVSEKLAGYKHATDPNVERDILEYPEPNIWARILLPQQHPSVDIVSKPKTFLGTKNKFDKTSTPRTGVNGNTVRDFNSPSVGITPGPKDKGSHFEEVNQANGLPRNNSSRDLAESFVKEISVDIKGTEVHPFNAASSGNIATEKNSSINGTLNLDIETMQLPSSVSTATTPMARLIEAQQNELANTKSANVTISKSALDPMTIPPISYEEEMDHNCYAEYRILILKLAEEPRNPVILLTLANFLYSQKMDDESMAVLNRTIEVLKDWKLTPENNAMILMLQSKVGIRVNGEYEGLGEMKSHAISCRDSPVILSQVAMYYNRLKYIEQAEQLYIAALLLDPLNAEANRGYAHVLIQKANYNAANRYFVRVSEHSVAFSIVKTEQGWLQEMMGADDEAILLAFKKCLALGNRDRGTSCALYSLGHFFHVRSDFIRAVDFYRRSLMYNPNEHQTLLLLGCLGNLMPHAYNKNQVDAWMRRGLLIQPHGSARWIALVIYAESIISNFCDFDRASNYLWTAVRESYTKEIWAVVSLAHYYQNIRCDPLRAKRLLLWSARGRARARNLQVNASDATYLHNLQFESSGMNHLDQDGDDESGGFGFGGKKIDPSDDSGGYFKKKVSGEESVLHVAIAYCHMDLQEFDHALIHATKALDLDKNLSAAHRVMGLLLFKERKFRKEAIVHFNSSLNDSSNQYSSRTAAVVMALEGNYNTALTTMEASVQGGCNNPLGWRVLGIMTYLYGENINIDNSILYLTKAIDLSDGFDMEAIRLKGQLLMEIGKYSEARICFQSALSLVPGDNILLASFGLCLSAIGFKSPLGSNFTDYEVRFASLRSLGEFFDSEDPEELFLASTTPNLTEKIRLKREGANDDNENKTTILSSSIQIMQEIPAITNSKEKNKETSLSESTDDADVPPDVLYWYAMYHMRKTSTKAQNKAKTLFTRAVQRSDCPPHPLALYMLGWLAELQSDISVAERYYSYALQLEPIDSIYFLKLQALVKDTYTFVKSLAKSAEKSETARKKLLKKKLKQRRNGASVPIGKEGDESGQLKANFDLIRKRLLLHERVQKLSLLRKKELGKRVNNLNTPGKCVFIEPFWLERALHAFSECDDWACLLKSSIQSSKM